MALMSPTPELLRVTDAARVAGVSLRTMRRWVTSGQVVTVGRGRTRRVVASSLSRQGANGDTDGHADGVMRATDTATSDGRSAMGANGDTGDTEDVTLAALVALVDRYKAEAQENAIMAAIWQERARVLADRLALAAPQAPDGPGAPHPAPGSTDPPPEPPRPFPWPLPPTPNVRALAPWLVLAAILCAAVVVGWGPAWHW